MVGFPSRSRARRHPEPSPHFTQKNNIDRRWPRSVIFLQKRILPRNARITPLNCFGLCSGAKWLTPCRRINSPPGILRARYSNRAFKVTGPLCVHSNGRTISYTAPGICRRLLHADPTPWPVKESAVFTVLCASPQHLHFTHSLGTDADWRHGFNPFVRNILN